MPTEVRMPQMGESIAEGTIVRWIKNVGDQVDRDEPLFEISTDKVDAEIPSPAAGVLSEIRVNEGETVAVNSIVALIGQKADVASPPPAGEPAPPDRPGPDASGARAGEAGAVSAGPRPAEVSGRPLGREERRRLKSSPVVRKIARERGVDISAVPGSGTGGRVTREDILAYLEKRSEGRAPEVSPSVPAYKEGERVEIAPMSIMRRKIAEHMILSRRTSAHVHTVFEADFSRVARIRDARREEFERSGARLTYLVFIARAVVSALRAFPIVNASVDRDRIVYKKDINLGIAVALDEGLIVPVVRNADQKNLLGLALAIADVAGRARNRQLSPDDVQGGTFTITNPGVFGALFGMPIINQPQVAILGVGAVTKRPVAVEDDAVAVRPMAYLTLGYDHRLIDGASADRFMSHVREQIEGCDPDGT